MFINIIKLAFHRMGCDQRGTLSCCLRPRRHQQKLCKIVRRKTRSNNVHASVLTTWRRHSGIRSRHVLLDSEMSNDTIMAIANLDSRHVDDDALATATATLLHYERDGG
jgi:hypothetical protein